jgi:hypothetical protein
LNFHEHLQTFQIVPSGGERYWVWGVSFYSDDVELYQVAPEDQARENLFGGGDVWIADLVPTNSGFETIVKPANMDGSRAVATLSFDGADTSEFGLNAAVAKDTDYDGIPDELETGDGTVQSGGTSPEDADSDGDGLPDPIEDKNRNGIWDKNEGELCAYNPDTDSDGLSDWAETHGDGVYDKGIDTDPFNPDTDGDGLLDGQEDANGNGIWDGYLKESSPLLADSDGDGFADKIDTCPSIANPGQDPWYCK